MKDTFFHVFLVSASWNRSSYPCLFPPLRSSIPYGKKKSTSSGGGPGVEGMKYEGAEGRGYEHPLGQVVPGYRIWGDLENKTLIKQSIPF